METQKPSTVLATIPVLKTTEPPKEADPDQWFHDLPVVPEHPYGDEPHCET